MINITLKALKVLEDYRVKEKASNFKHFPSLLHFSTVGDVFGVKLLISKAGGKVCWRSFHEYIT